MKNLFTFKVENVLCENIFYKHEILSERLQNKKMKKFSHLRSIDNINDR